MSDLWHKLRSENIGGSDIAALFGESSYTTYYKLWHEKRGLILPDDLDQDERVQAGKFMEQGTIAWSNHKWGTEFYQPRVYVKHPTVKGMACTPDAFDRSNHDCMSQIKVVDTLQFSLKWQADKDTIIEAPLEILLQVQHEMECCQISESWLIVLVGGNRLFKMICQRDEEIGAALRRAVAEFWQRSQAPEPEFDRDGSTINQIRKSLPIKEMIDMTGDEYFYNLTRRGLAATVGRNKMQDEVDAINAEVCHLVGNTASVRCGDMLLKFHKGQKTPRYISQGETL